MKHACIVLRNIKNDLNSDLFSGIVGVFISGGYYFDKLEFLSYEDVSLFKQSVVEFKNFYDTLTVVADCAILREFQGYIEECYNRPFRTKTILDYDAKTVFLLPAGKSGEEAARVESVPYLNRKYAQRFDRMVVRAVGVPPDLLNEALKEAYDLTGSRLSYNVSERYADVRIEVIYDGDTPKMLLDDVLRVFAVRLNDYIYALEDLSLVQRLHQALRLRKLNVSVAESFTGGGICQRLVEEPGISDVFFEGLNTYANLAKQKRLNVSEYTLMNKGAVSDDTAYEMALGLLQTGSCDLAIATTGIAGPSSDQTSKPVGLCYIAIGLKSRVFVYRYNFTGDRETITKTAINYALFLAYKQIK